MRGGSETGGFRPRVTGLPSFSGRPLSLLVKKTLFYSEEHSLLVFSSFLAVVRPNDGLLSASILFSPLYFFFLRPLIVGRMLLSPGTYLSVSACLSHNSICVCKCVCLWVCVCVSYHLQVNLQITGHVCLLYISVSLSACVCA